MASRIAHHIDFPDYDEAELMQIARLMLDKLNYRFDDEAEAALRCRAAAPRAAAFRQRPLDPQRARSHPAAPGDAAVRQQHRALAATSSSPLRAEDILSSRVFNPPSEPRHEPRGLDLRRRRHAGRHRGGAPRRLQQRLRALQARLALEPDEYKDLLKTTGGKERIAAYIAKTLSNAERKQLTALIPAIHAENRSSTAPSWPTAACRCARAWRG